MTGSRHDVVIVGGGPTGLSAANLLGLYGIDTLLIEQNADISDQPKAILIDDEFYRLFVRIGVADRLDEHLVPAVGVHFLSPFGFALVKVDGFITDNGYPNRQATSQPLLEAALRDNIARFPCVELAFGHSVQKVERHGDGALLHVLKPDGGKAALSCRYAIGCDGAHSIVRRLSGMTFEGDAIDQPHVVVDVADDPDQAQYSRFFCHPSRPRNSVPAPFGGRRYEFMLLPGEDMKGILDDINLARLFHGVRSFADMKILRKAVYVFHNRLVDRMRNGPLFVAGDAAHLMPPFGAQGMNSGGKDVSNLCWKLSAVLKGEASDALLDSYHDERHAHARAIIDLSVRIGRIANMRHWPLALMRDAIFLLLNLFPACRRYFSEQRYVPRQRYLKGVVVTGTISANSFVGRMLPCPLVTDGSDRQGKLDSFVGNGWCFIGVAIDVPALPWTGAEPLSLSIVRNQTGKAMLAVDDHRFDRVFAAHSGEVLLVRPDFYVAAAFRPDDWGAVSTALASYFEKGQRMMKAAA